MGRKVVWLNETTFSVGDVVFECEPPPSDPAPVEHVMGELGAGIERVTLYRTDNPDWDEFGDPLY